MKIKIKVFYRNIPQAGFNSTNIQLGDVFIKSQKTRGVLNKGVRLVFSNFSWECFREKIRRFVKSSVFCNYYFDCDIPIDGESESKIKDLEEKCLSGELEQLEYVEALNKIKTSVNLENTAMKNMIIEELKKRG